MRLITRTISWLYRFSCSLEQLGFINTIKLFIIDRLLNREMVIRLPNQLKFNCHARLDMVTSHFYSLGYYIDINNGPSIKTILDAGANIGVETARFHIHYPTAEIIAVEAAERNFNFLNKSFEQIKTVHPVFGGLWSKQTNLKVTSTSKDMQAFQVEESVEQEGTINAFTIPQLMKEYNWEQIDILKLDIEGAEYELFSKNFNSWINKVNVLIFEVPDTDHPGATQLIFKRLSDMNFRTYHCGENLVLIKNELPWILKKVIGFERT